jgi:hypothetical protein
MARGKEEKEGKTMRGYGIMCRTAHYPCWIMVADAPSHKAALSRLRAIRLKMRQVGCRGVLRVEALSRLQP